MVEEEKEVFEGGEWLLEEACLVHWPDEPKRWCKPKYITRTIYEVPLRTTDQEIDLINEQVESSGGFDIDFKQFRCLFSYHPVDLEANEFIDEPKTETNADLLKRLCKKSLADYNHENETEYEVVKPLYANFHMAGHGVMFLITFQVKDPHAADDDNVTKEFQARVHYSFLYDNKYVFCRPKAPVQQVSSSDEDSGKDTESDLKKPRLE